MLVAWFLSRGGPRKRLSAELILSALVFGLVLAGCSTTTPESSCSVHIAGQDMVATVTGANANEVCQNWVAGGGVAGTTAATADACDPISADNLQIEVQDTGFQGLGDTFCTALQKWAKRGGPLPFLDGTLPGSSTPGPLTTPKPSPRVTARPAVKATAPPAPKPTAKPAKPSPIAARPLPANAYPNPQFTPGQAFAGVTTAEVCTSGWATKHRDVSSSQYHEVYGEYGIAYPEPTGSYELDHLIPLELGGDNANANLWPEPALPTPGFHQKDLLENGLHSLVCNGSMSLATAQHLIASNWYAAYLRYVL